MRQLRFTWHHKPPNSLWGRFGGGWQWKLGIQSGGSTVIINLLVAYLRIEWAKPRTNKED